jgi:KamA family protein
LVATNLSEDKGRFRAINRVSVRDTPQWRKLAPELQEAIQIVSLVLPFRTNRYVMDHLIDWEQVPDDPMYQLTFSQKGMLQSEDYARLARMVEGGASREVLDAEANRIRFSLNPQPAGQKTHNVPTLAGLPLPGMQHKYRETVLFFPKRGQTCPAYCSYCFRWAQFVGVKDIRFAATSAEQLVAYLKQHPEVSDVLITGGDPAVMRTRVLRQFVEPLLALDHLNSIRIGTKALATWPKRFTHGDDADDLLRLFEEVVASGKQLALMAHYSHHVEMSTPEAERAIRRVRNSGANIRMQSPVARHINDSPQVWAELLRKGVRLGCIPYYMFVVRDTGARGYFAVPLIRCWEIYQQAYRSVSGLARTIRGPVMSAFPGKVHLLGVTSLDNERVFTLQYLQSRNPELVRRPFFARFDPEATWFDQLIPANAEDAPFFTDQTPPKPRLVREPPSPTEAKHSEPTS